MFLVPLARRNPSMASYASQPMTIAQFTQCIWVSDREVPLQQPECDERDDLHGHHAHECLSKAAWAGIGAGGRWAGHGRRMYATDSGGGSIGVVIQAGSAASGIFPPAYQISDPPKERC